ncbi:Nitrite-sensitive transcriptional repressor NsrR [Labilithrix luteola]|uniref:Nitrite-sensitive transcriptional repressor NsrR n=1 Tax=Labilithrix luteola TaxID=1391654 RepID=A0A0K1QF52_9BACT|nr:Rrf2 family transcriptional regulator [Labilithrix luteola]AKV04272.1 Nitrite-sensitive transcriptional repressor NsrR [Labilithrix luteola]
MRLTQYTDYALRIVLYLGAHPDETPNSATISKAFGISAHHTATIAKRMVQEGILAAKRGRGGGLRLAHDLKTLKVGDFVVRMERTMHLAECFDAKKNRCPVTGACTLKGVLEGAQAAFIDSLNQHTLADLVHNGPQLVQLLNRGARARGASSSRTRALAT